MPLNPFSKPTPSPSLDPPPSPTPPLPLPPPPSPTSATSSPILPLPLRPIALTLLFACPLLALAPPRKLDFYTFSLATAWAISASHLYNTTPSSTSPWSKAPTAPLSEEGVAPALRPEKEEGLARRVWMGGERRGWEKKRMEEERERMEEGLGIGELMRERVREVFFGEEGDGNGEREGEEREEEGSGREHTAMDDGGKEGR